MTPVRAVLTRSTNVATSMEAIERFTPRSLAGAPDRRRDHSGGSATDHPFGRPQEPIYTPAAGGSPRSHRPATGSAPRRPQARAARSRTVSSNISQNYPYSSESEEERASQIARAFAANAGLADKVRSGAIALRQDLPALTAQRVGASGPRSQRAIEAVRAQPRRGGDPAMGRSLHPGPCARMIPSTNLKKEAIIPSRIAPPDLAARSPELPASPSRGVTLRS